MTQPFVIIDGYNLMHAVGLARQQYGPGDLEVCRNRLLQQLSARLNSTASGRTTVVFDAFGSNGNTNRLQEREGITIIYAPAGTDADSELERMIAAHSTPKRLLVVSSDHRLHKAAQRRKAKAIDSDVFWDSLDPESSQLRDPASRLHRNRQLSSGIRNLPMSKTKPVSDVRRTMESSMATIWPIWNQNSVTSSASGL